MKQLSKKTQEGGGLARPQMPYSLRMKLEALASASSARGSSQLKVCFAFDTTGSMYPVFDQGRKAIREIADAVTEGARAEIAFIAYKNHSDEQYFDGERPFAATDWSSETDKIRALMEKVSSDGGGDGITCLEDVLEYLAESVDWGNAQAKVLVIIGDMPPHGVVDSVNRCPRQIDYRRQIASLKEQGVAIYTVWCETDLLDPFASERKKKIEEFYRETARTTGGQCLSLEDIQTLIAILVGICFKETGRLSELADTLARMKRLTPGAQRVVKALQAPDS